MIACIKLIFTAFFLTVWASTYYTYLSLRSVVPVFRETVFYVIFKVQLVRVVYSAFFI